MYALVDDVAAYPQFLPLCCASEVLSRQDEVMVARVAVARGPLRLAWTTRNVREPGRSIQMALQEGPFERLEGRWNFDRVDDRASHISLGLRYDLAPGLRGIAGGLLFDQVVRSLVKAFIDRAGELYD